MANDNKTVAEIVREARRELEIHDDSHDWKLCLGKLLPRIEAANKREMKHNESLLSKAGETVVGLMNKMNAQHEEIKKLRALVKELAECLYGNPCTECGMYCCAECKHRREMDSLVARANDEANGGEDDRRH